jgi:hypothetical protein
MIKSTSMSKSWQNTEERGPTATKAVEGLLALSLRLRGRSGGKEQNKGRLA